MHQFVNPHFTFPLLRRAVFWAALLVASSASVAVGPSDVVLPDTEGKPVAVSQFTAAGKWTMLNIWGPRCPPCLEEVSELTAFHEANAATAQVVGLAIDFPSFGSAKLQEVLTFIDDWFVNFPVLLTDATVMERLTGQRLKAVPTSLIYDPAGRLARVHVGTVTQAELEAFINAASASSRATPLQQRP